MIDDFYGEMAKLIFSVLDGGGHEIKMYDENAKQVFTPEKANRIWSNSQKIMIVLGKTEGSPPKPLVKFCTSDVTNPAVFDDFKNAITAHNIYDFTFETEPFATTLEPGHFEFMDIKESNNWTGTTRTSYFPIDNVNVVIRHSRPWNSDQMEKAQRWRRIKQILLFTPDGQRFKFPHNHVLGARAMAQHLNHENNSMHDNSGKLIQDLTKLLFDLRKIQFKCRPSQEWAIQAHIVDTRQQIRRLLKAISQTHRYTESVDRAKTWINEWSSKKFVKSPQQELVTSDPELATSAEAPLFKESRQLQEWFDSFEPKTIFENQEKAEQVQIAFDQSGGDIFRTLDILRRMKTTDWNSRFEEDPKSVTDEVTEIVDTLKKSS